MENERSRDHEVTPSIPGWLRRLARARVGCDDAAARFSRVTSAQMLLLLATIVGLKQYSGNPIHCWAPAHFPASHVAYTESVCWSNSIYYFAGERGEPGEEEEGGSMVESIAYYRLVPVILAVQALLCALPGLIWNGLCRRSGPSLVTIMETAGQAERPSDACLDWIARQLTKAAPPLPSSRWKKAGPWGGRARQCLQGRVMSTWFVVVKLAYACNAVVQLSLIYMTLGEEDLGSYGLLAIRPLSGNLASDWVYRGVLPRIIMCQFNIPHNTEAKRIEFTVQCSLPINDMNETIFTCVWFWLLLVFCISLFSFSNWCNRLNSATSREAYLGNMLASSGASPTDVSKFSARHISQDAFLTINLINISYGHQVASRLVIVLWEQWSQEGVGDGEKPAFVEL